MVGWIEVCAFVFDSDKRGGMPLQRIEVPEYEIMIAVAKLLPSRPSYAFLFTLLIKSPGQNLKSVCPQHGSLGQAASLYLSIKNKPTYAKQSLHEQDMLAVSVMTLECG